MRLLAVTGDASLLVALTSMLRDDWEVQIVSDPAAAASAAPDAAVVLVDFGTTDRGLETAEQIWQLGVTLPCLVVGDVPAPEARASVLVRPFTLHDLIGAIITLVPEQIVELPDPRGLEEAAVPQAVLVETAEPAEESVDASAESDAEPPAEAVDEHVDEPERATVAERTRGLFRRKPAQPRPATGDALADQIRRALAGLQDLDVLIDKLPPLARPRAMAHAFLGEVVQQLRPETAAVYVLGSDGTFGVVASHGLSPAEAGMKVPPEQLLFMEITSSLEAVLVAPVDLARGLVSGIGGARTEALMAAPVTVDGACHGVIIAGRKDFSAEDLDTLAGLANEAGPGLAVAQTIERLRSR